MRTGFDTLERIRSTIQLSNEDWAELLQLTPAGYQLLGLRDPCEIPDRVASDLCDYVGITPEALQSGIIDFKTLAKQVSGNVSFVPERYSEGAFSKRRTSGHLLDLIEIRYGWRERLRLLRTFQVTDAIFADPDGRINLRFLSDLCAYLRGKGFSRDALAEMGQHSVVTNYAGPLGRHFRRLRNVQKAYESCFTEVINRYYDENFVYELVRMDEHSCTVECRYRPEVLDATRSRAPGNEGTCSTRAGAFASIPGYLDLPYAKVTESSCIHRGDPLCRYEIDFDMAVRAESIHEVSEAEAQSRARD